MHSYVSIYGRDRGDDRVPKDDRSNNPILPFELYCQYVSRDLKRVMFGHS